MSKKAKAKDGFTIIEVIFVLAIAGIILSIVFLAVPALTRNSRNNQRRQDVQTILADVSHYELENSGCMPGDGCGGSVSSFLNGSTLTYYSPSVSYTALTSPPGACPANSAINLCIADNWTDTPSTAPANSDVDKVMIYNHQKCSSTGGTSTSTAAGFSDVVALYAVETGSGTEPQCQQL